MDVLRVGAAMTVTLLAGYAAGAWYAGRQADERWTAGAVERFVDANHQGRIAEQELFFVCGDTEYAYRVGATGVRKQPAKAEDAATNLLPKLSAAEAFGGMSAVVTVAKAQGLAAVLEAPKSKSEWAFVVASAAMGFYVGYNHHRETTPGCERKWTQVVLNDVEHWKMLIERRERLDATLPGHRFAIGTGARTVLDPKMPD